MTSFTMLLDGTVHRFDDDEEDTALFKAVTFVRDNVRDDHRVDLMLIPCAVTPDGGNVRYITKVGRTVVVSRGAKPRVFI